MVHDLSLSDLDFERIPVACYSPCGKQYIRRICAGMPRVPEKILTCTFYLYASKEDAEEGSKFGGTGFLVAVPSERYPTAHVGNSIYGITNRHVAIRGGFSIVRINTSDGKVQIFETDPSDWIPHPDGDDIAACYFDLSGPGHSASTALLTMIFATKERVEKWNVGVGDDVFMIGRFVDHDGGPTNRPAARFGNISIMPSPIEHDDRMVESYCIDMHSRSGYSGSPVFVYRTPGGNLHDTFSDNGNLNLAVSFLFLLGIHWGQFPEQLEIVNKKIRKESSTLELVDGLHIKGTSGMTIVSPAWKILEVLNLDSFKKGREELDKKLQMEEYKRTLPPVEESLIDESDSSHREDFNNLLDAAVRGKPSSD